MIEIDHENFSSNEDPFIMLETIKQRNDEGWLVYNLTWHLQERRWWQWWKKSSKIYTIFFRRSVLQPNEPLSQLDDQSGIDLSVPPSRSHKHQPRKSGPSYGDWENREPEIFEGPPISTAGKEKTTENPEVDKGRRIFPLPHPGFGVKLPKSSET